MNSLQLELRHPQTARGNLPFALRHGLPVLALAALLPLPVSAYTTGANNLLAVIPDGDLNGYQNSLSLSGLSGNVQHVSVTLNLAGGFNGDLYAYLYHDGVSAILLNRVGLAGGNSTGYPNAGFGPDALGTSFTLDDLAGHDVHAYQSFSYTLSSSGQLTGAWQPDGRAIDPRSAGSAFDSATRSAPLSRFNGMDPNGTWSLFVADVSPGAESTLVGWGLALEVPEPATGGLLLCGLAGLFARRYWGASVQK